MLLDGRPPLARDYPDRPIVGVGVVVFRGDAVLLVKRAKPPLLGQWSLPGGMQELGETLEAAARREIREEAGLDLAKIEFLTTVDLIDLDAEQRIRHHYTLIDFWALAAHGAPAAGSDAHEAVFMPPAEVATLTLWSETRRIIELASARRELAGGPRSAHS